MIYYSTNANSRANASANARKLLILKLITFISIHKFAEAKKLPRLRRVSGNFNANKFAL